MSDHHVRRQIRDEFRARIEAAGLNSFKGPRSLDEIDLPAGGVLTDDESSQLLNMQGMKSRVVDVAVLVIVEAGPDEIEDVLDEYAAKLEKKLEQDPIEGVKQLELTSTSMELESDEEGNRWYGYLSLVYQATYFTRHGAPTVAA